MFGNGNRWERTMKIGARKRKNEIYAIFRKQPWKTVVVKERKIIYNLPICDICHRPPSTTTITLYIRKRIKNLKNWNKADIWKIQQTLLFLL